MFLIPTNKSNEYWQIIILFIIVFLASAYMVYVLKTGVRMFPRKTYFQMSETLMNVYTPRPKLLKWKGGGINIVKVIECCIALYLTIIRGG